MTKPKDQKVKFHPECYQDHLKGKEGQIPLAAFRCIIEEGIAATSASAIALKVGLNQDIIHY
jgi:AcrR family transcriptional regulator